MSGNTDLKAKGIAAALQHEADLYHNTRNPQYVWQAWQLARAAKVRIPDWVLRFLDALARSEVTKRNRQTDTADRYEAALVEMEVAVDRHRNRLKIRKVGKALGVDVPISRRDKPNLTAIARSAAAANGVSVNRLLNRYRVRIKPAKR